MLNNIDQLIPADANVLITYGGESAKKYGTLEKVKTALGNRRLLWRYRAKSPL